MPFGYHIAPPNEAMLVSGRKSQDNTFKVYLGQGKWVLPLFRQVTFLTLQAQQVDVTETCPSQECVEFTFTAAITYHIGHDEANIKKAAKLFLGDPRGLVNFAHQIFTGHLRSIVGAMTIKDIMQNRQGLAKEVLDASEAEMANMGIIVKSFQIQDIKDASGYITAMAAKSVADVKRDADIAQAAAAQQSVQKQQESEQAQAQSKRDTHVKVAQLQAEVDAETEKASQAGPLAKALARQQVTVTEKETARLQAELVEQQLVADKIKPAEASRQQTVIEAEAHRSMVRIAAEAEASAQVAEAEGQALVAEQEAKAAGFDAQAIRAKGQAEADALKAGKLAEAEGAKALAVAAATEGKVSLEQLLIETMPEIVGKAASAFQGSNMTFLNGTSGANKAIAELVGQAPIFIDMIRSALHHPLELDGSQESTD
jgi:uncharacterized membrane protein YqiK